MRSLAAARPGRYGKRRIEKIVTLNESFSVTAAEGVREGIFASLGLCVATEWMRWLMAMGW